MEITINIKGLDGLAAAIASLAASILPDGNLTAAVPTQPEAPALLIEEPFTPVSDAPRIKRKSPQHEFICVTTIAAEIAEAQHGDRAEIRRWIYENYAGRLVKYNGHYCVHRSHRNEIFSIYNR